MSVNQSRGDKNEPSQYIRSGRSANPNSPRKFSGGGGKGGGGGGHTTTAPPSSASYSVKSFKKVVSNAQGAHDRVTGPNPNVNSGFPNSSAGGIAPQNGANIQPPTRGTLDASSTGAPVKVADASVHKSTPGIPKAPQSNAVQLSSGATGPTGPSTPVKASGDASRAFPLQFGSISLGVMNGMQEAARTNSVPPNMDEQRRAQARLDSLKATTFQNPATVPKQHFPRKDAGQVDKPNVNACPTSEDKKEALPSAPHATADSQKPTGPPMPSIPPIPMQMPFHKSQIHRPFGGPNPQLQSQSMANTSLPVPLSMHLPVGNPPQVPPQVFVQHHHHHHHHHQGIIHQIQGLPFGNMGMGMGLGPQYQQQGLMGNLNSGSAHRTVKITHLETHEELQLDKPANGYPNGMSSVPQPHLHGPPLSQAVRALSPAHSMNPLYISPPGSTWRTPGSQPPRFCNQHASKQWTVKLAVSSHAEKDVRTSPPVIGKTEISKSQKVGGECGTSSQPHKGTVAGSALLQYENLTDGSASPAAAVEDSTSVNSASEAAKKVTANRSGSFKEEQKQSCEKVQSIPVDEIGGQSSSVSTSSVIDSGIHEILMPSTLWVEGSNKVVFSDESASKCDTIEKGLNSTKIIGSETHSNNSPKVEDPIAEIPGTKEQVKELDQNHNCTVSDVVSAAQQKEPVNYIDDKSSGSVTTTVYGDQIFDLSKLDVEQVSSQEPTSLNEELPALSVSVPETPPLTSEVEATASIAPSSWKVKGNNNAGKGKKKIRDILKKADARGTTSDLYNAYKRPEEKKETLSSENPAVNSQGGGPMQRNTSDSNRWASGTGYQKGLMPSHNASAMHKAERKYEVGKVTDEEQAKQRQLKGILNKLTPWNIEKLLHQVKQVNIDNANTLSGVVGQIFDKVLMEPTFVEMYAYLCSRLSMELPDFMSEKKMVTFKRLLLNKCQEEFERGVREKDEANRTEEEGEVKHTEEEREEKRVKSRRRKLGNIRLIGELYKKRMLTERIMHECIKKLLGQHQNPDEDDIEALCKLMSTIGEMIDHPKAKEYMDVYFDMMLKLSNNMDLSSRLRFVLKDVIDLRKNKWQERRKVEGPKKIEEVHRDAANERQAQTNRLTGRPSFNPGSIRRGGLMEFGPKGSSNVLPLNPQMSGFRVPPQQLRGFRVPPQQLRGFGSHDLRIDSFESWTTPTALPVPLRPMGDDNITIVLQGGLARGMPVRVSLLQCVVLLVVLLVLVRYLRKLVTPHERI